MPTCDPDTEYWDGTKCCPKFNEVLGMLITSFEETIIRDRDKLKDVTKFIQATIKAFQEKYPPGELAKDLEPNHQYFDNAR